MYRKIADIIPHRFRRQGAAVAVTVLLRAVLNFFGIALLIPLLMLILDAESLHAHPILQKIYLMTHVADERQFVIIAAVAVVLAIVLKNIVYMWLYRYQRNYIYDLYRDLARKLYVSYFRRGLAFVVRSNSSELSRSVNFVSLNFVTGILQPLAVIVGEAALFLFIFAALAIYSLTAALLLAVIFIPAVLLYYRLIRQRMNRYGRAENTALRTMFRNVTESFKGYADIQINNAFDRILSDFGTSADKLVEVRKHDAAISVMPQAVTETAITVGLAALVTAGVYLPQSDIKLIFGLFALAAVRLTPSVRNILGAVTALRYNRYTIDTLAAATEDTPSFDPERIHFTTQIELRNVSFGFDQQTESDDTTGDTSDLADDQTHDRHATIINDLSLTIRRGERIGIQGASGAGKTTLMRLMLGLYSPQHGEILIDGRTLDSSNIRKWQNAIGYVPQNVFIADASLAENIALGQTRSEIDPARIAEALAAASLTEFAERLTEGIDTMIGESGCRISGGERQRIGIARALYRRPDVLFFDEATSALDNDTERSINTSIEQLSTQNKDLTIVVIAHRKTSLEYCDRIIEIGK